MSVPKTRPKGVSQTLKVSLLLDSGAIATFYQFQQPGKLNLKNFSLVTEAIARMNVGSKESRSSNFGNAPLATPEVVDLGSEYAQVKDMIHNIYPPDVEYMYTLVQDAVSGKSKLRQRREKGQPCKYLRLPRLHKIEFMHLGG